LAYRNGFQVAVHAIGDRANREVLDVFDALFDGRDRGVRYRVEHAQHIDPVDIPRFAQLGIIPSVQGIHMSSDRPWAIDRLGQKRIEQGAYMWRDLIDTGAILVNGTDVPVEPVNPFASFYALVTRQTLAGDPEGGFEPGQKISRAEALRAYTLNAAYAAFEEQEKGSLSPGKLADFVVLDRDIMTIPADEILATRVLTTYVSGQVVYQYPQTEALVKVER
jgi:predicted amidohydrolase YtcJ